MGAGEEETPTVAVKSGLAGAIKEGWSKRMVEELKYSGPRW